MGDTGLNVSIGPGFNVHLGFNPPERTESESGEVEYKLACDPSRIDDLFKTANTILDRNGKGRLTRAEFNARVKWDEVSKPAVNFTLQLQVDCENAVRYLRDEGMDEEGVVSLPGTSLQGVIGDWLNHHAVTIFSIPEERKLIGEVVYFGNVAGLAVLSNEYDGPGIIAGHSINLKTGVFESADLDVLRNLQELYLPTHSVMELVRSRIGRFKSPIVLQLLKDLDEIALKAS